MEGLSGGPMVWLHNLGIEATDHITCNHHPPQEGQEGGQGAHDWGVGEGAV